MGDFEKGKQVFQLNNLAMLVLINIDEAQYKKLSFANLKRKIEPYGVNCEESRHQLRRTVCELLYSGLLRSPTKKIEVGSPDLCRVDETDEFEINRSYDFVQ